MKVFCLFLLVLAGSACATLTRNPVVFSDPVVFHRPVIFQNDVVFEEGVEWQKKQEAGADQISFLTYNVKMWNYQEGLQRLAPVMATLKQSNADVIALQETSYWFLYLLSRQDWVRSRYKITTHRGHLYAPGGLAILSRFPIKKVETRLLSRQSHQRARYALVALLDAHEREVAVSNVHLESLLDATWTRMQQLDEVLAMLKPYRNKVILGDFNFGDHEPENSLLEKSFADLWQKLKPGMAGYTWNMEASWMARKHSFKGESSRRLDRILVDPESMEARAVRLCGVKPFYFHTGEVFASDHFGVLGLISLKQGVLAHSGAASGKFLARALANYF